MPSFELPKTKEIENKISKSQPTLGFADEKQFDSYLTQSIDKKIEEKLAKERRDLSSTLLVTFGIFASIVVFLSVQVQILPKATSFNQLAFLSLLLIFSLLSFIVILQWVTKTWIENNLQSGSKYVIGVLIFLVVLLLIFGYGSIREQRVSRFDKPLYWQPASSQNR